MEADKYEVLEMIGRGSFGVIRKVRRKSDGHVLCRKEINYLQMSSKEREQLQAELAILRNLRHPNIVAYYEREHLKASSDLHIYMEYCEQGDLGKRIKAMKKSNQMAEEDFVWSVFAQLISALYRCHYGEDPPEVGKNVIGLGSDARPLKSKMSHEMILHRDLKPENIFLGADASVKLGDFGLSKIMQSHDFASTYVGTPFYMSPEICAAEHYSLHSDIWALGCIMYELCAKEPPFNAKTHLDLIQKIRLGKIKPLSGVYSPELQGVISHCLRVNPHSRPDTVHLLNLPMVKLKRKELEVVTVGRQMKAREEQAARQSKEVERRLAHLDADREAMRVEIDSTVRREWELKAHLEIDRQVQIKIDRLSKDFESEVSRRVLAELSKKKNDEVKAVPVRSLTPDHDLPQGYHRSQSTTGETDEFNSSTDLSEISSGSRNGASDKTLKKSARTPFGRAQTMIQLGGLHADSPLDVEMIDPSPAPIGSLGLSPRHTKPPIFTRNIFAAANRTSTFPDSSQIGLEDEVQAVEEEDDDTDDVPALPSPSRAKPLESDPFRILGARRPPLLRQKTAPMQKHLSQPSLFGSTPALPKIGTIALKENQALQQHALMSAPLFPKTTNTSPHRRLTKIPSSTAPPNSYGSPQRKAPPPPTSPSRPPSAVGARPSSRAKNEDIRHTAIVNSAVQGRTLVELAQARTGTATRDFAEDDAGPAKEAKPLYGEEKRIGVTVWDPERDEMPSPFLARAGRGVMPGLVGGPGMRHLR